MLLGFLLGLVAVVAASPITIDDYARAVEDRGVTVSQTDYNNMKFYVQHAAAAYCNYNTPAGTDITCGRNVCPSVQANKPVITGSWVGQKTGIGAYVAVDHVRKEIVLAVRGSNNIRNFITDVIFSWQGCDLTANCKVHTGFATAWAEIQEQAKNAVWSALGSNNGYRVVVAGHSLGGAVATLAGAYLRRDGLACDVYTFGSPRVGNDHFANWMVAQNGKEWRMTHRDDPVPRLPPIFIGYRHISPEYWLDGGSADQATYPLSSVRICTGIANVACNGGTFGLNIISHLHYLSDTSGCGNPFQWKRDDVSNKELEQRLNAWSQKDQDFVKAM